MALAYAGVGSDSGCFANGDVLSGQTVIVDCQGPVNPDSGFPGPAVVRGNVSATLQTGPIGATSPQTHVVVRRWVLGVSQRGRISSHRIVPAGTFAYCAGQRAKTLLASVTVSGPMNIAVREVWSRNGQITDRFKDPSLTGATSFGIQTSRSLPNGLWSLKIYSSTTLIGSSTVRLSSKACHGTPAHAARPPQRRRSRKAEPGRWRGPDPRAGAYAAPSGHRFAGRRRAFAEWSSRVVSPLERSCRLAGMGRRVADTERLLILLRHRHLRTHISVGLPASLTLSAEVRVTQRPLLAHRARRRDRTCRRVEASLRRGSRWCPCRAVIWARPSDHQSYAGPSWTRARRVPIGRIGFAACPDSPSVSVSYRGALRTPTSRPARRRGVQAG